MAALTRRTLLLAGLGLPAGALAAQQPPSGPGTEPPPPSAFDQVIGRPTGTNGYEEIVAAADMIRRSALWGKVEGQIGSPAGCPLAAKRAVFHDPPVVQALALLQRGLGKPVRSPRDPAKLSAATPFPELGGMRSVARLLALRQYVQLADGQVTEALGTAEQTVILGRAVQVDVLISCLVGMAISAIGIRSLGGSLEQLSLPHCERLFRFCVDELKHGDSLATALQWEQHFAYSALQKLQGADLKGFFELTTAGDGDEPDEDGRRLREEYRRLRATPGGLERLLERARRQVDDTFAEAQRQARRPPWERQLPAGPADDGSLLAMLTNVLLPGLDPLNTIYARERAYLQLLACHAAILATRWETEQLPESLGTLGLGDLAVDPFTGQPLLYERLREGYRLISVGAPADADDPKAVDGRRPVTVTPD